jgi:hypothetical protein
VAASRFLFSELPEHLACVGTFAVVYPNLVKGVEVATAPQTESDGGLAILIGGHDAFAFDFGRGEVARVHFSHMPKLLVAVFRTCKKFNDACTVISFVHRDTMLQADTRRRLTILSEEAYRISFTYPVVPSYVTKMSMRHGFSPFQLLTLS